MISIFIFLRVEVQNKYLEIEAYSGFCDLCAVALALSRPHDRHGGVLTLGHGCVLPLLLGQHLLQLDLTFISAIPSVRVPGHEWIRPV